MENESAPRRTGPVLVPVDFSPASAKALVWAARYAREQGTSVVVLHVIHDPADAPGTYRDAQMSGDDDMMLPMGKAAERMMEDFVEGFRKEHPELLGDAETRLVIGVPTTRIQEVADAIDARMIAMGSRGRKGLTRMLLGSTAEEIVREAERPVVIFREERPDEKAKKAKKAKKDKDKKDKKDKAKKDKAKKDKKRKGGKDTSGKKGKSKGS